MFGLAQKSWFFNSAPGDPRVYQASDFAQYFGKVLSTGLLHVNEVPGLNVKAGGADLRTYVEPGSAIMEGYAYENTANEYLSHSLPEVSLDRIDRVVLRLDKKNANRYIKLFVREGEPASSPVPPTLQRDSLVWELSLAQVRIRANTSTISPTDVFDERLDRTVAGLTFSLISKPSMADIQTGGYAVVATAEGQTDFEIPLSSFDKVGDGLTVYVGGKKAEYSSYEVIYPRTVRFNVGVSIGTKVEFEIIRGVLKLADDYVVNAGEVGMVDAGGYYESENVEGALQKIGLTLFKPRPPIYGIEIDETNSNPTTAVSYIEDAKNLSITKGSDWDNYFPFNRIKPCLINTLSNQFITYLNPDNYAQKKDGTPVDISSVTGSDVFIEIPQIWWNIRRVGYRIQIRVCSQKIDDTWVAMAHQKGDILIPKLYLGAYRAHNDSYNRLRSISGKLIVNSANLSSVDAMASARNNNCDLSNYYERYVLPNILYLIRYKTRLQNQLGGAVKTDSASTGATNMYGLYTEVNPNSGLRAKFLGLEDVGGDGFDNVNLTGPLPEFLVGISLKENPVSGPSIQIATDEYLSGLTSKNYNAKDIVYGDINYADAVVGDNHLFLFPTSVQGSSSTYYPAPLIKAITLTGAAGIMSTGRRFRGTPSTTHQYRISYRPLVSIN